VLNILMRIGFVAAIVGLGFRVFNTTRRTFGRV
jgi:hypothetical protein